MPRPFLIGCFLLVLFGGFMMILFSFALLGGIGGGDQAEDPSLVGSTDIASTSDKRWTVAQLPPHWKTYYSDQEFSSLKQTIQEMVDQYLLPADEFMGILDKESSGNPNICSRAGAIGLGQFMSSTARDMSEFGDPEERVANRCNPIRSVRAAARKFSEDRRGNGGTDWGTLKDAYLGIRLANGKWKFTAYNPGAPLRDWNDIVTRARDFKAKRYVILNENAGQPTTIAGSADLNPQVLKRISQPFLDLNYGRSAKLRREDGPICLDCQTLVERTLAEALIPRFGSLGKSVDYLLKGADPVNNLPRGGRIQTPIPGWLHEAYGWPARAATIDVARSSGIEEQVKIARWQDSSGGLGAVAIEYIPWDQVPLLKGDATIDGTIVAFIGSPVSRGVTHVGFLFNEAGSVVLRHASSPSRGILDESLTERAKNTSRYTGIIILRPDSSRIK